MGVRLSSGIISLVAISAGDGGAIANNVLSWNLSTGKRAVLKKILWRNRTGGNGNLLVGYADRTVAGALFRQVLGSILMVNGVDGELREEDLPICGNSREGFVIDTTAVTGTIGDIYLGTDCAGVGAAPGNVQVVLEVEEV